MPFYPKSIVSKIPKHLKLRDLRRKYYNIQLSKRYNYEKRINSEF